MENVFGNVLFLGVVTKLKIRSRVFEHLESVRTLLTSPWRHDIVQQLLQKKKITGNLKRVLNKWRRKGYLQYNSMLFFKRENRNRGLFWCFLSAPWSQFWVKFSLFVEQTVYHNLLISFVWHFCEFHNRWFKFINKVRWWNIELQVSIGNCRTLFVPTLVPILTDLGNRKLLFCWKLPRKTTFLSFQNVTRRYFYCVF